MVRFEKHSFVYAQTFLSRAGFGHENFYKESEFMS